MPGASGVPAVSGPQLQRALEGEFLADEGECLFVGDVRIRLDDVVLEVMHKCEAGTQEKVGCIHVNFVFLRVDIIVTAGILVVDVCEFSLFF